MRRRGVLGLLGGALAAGPSMAKEAVSSIASMQVPGLIESGMAVGGSEQSYSAIESTGIPYDHIGWLKERLEEIVGLSDSARQERLDSTWVNSLDPDLAVNRSFSLSAKVRMQKVRNFEREIDREKRSLTRQIADYIKKQN